MMEKASSFCKLKEIDGLEILSLVDNSIELASSSDRVEVNAFRNWTEKRILRKGFIAHSNLPFAEHGFSMLIRLFQQDKSRNILFDTGSSSKIIIENSKLMGIQLNKIDLVILSHGHYDHSGGLPATIEAIHRIDLPIIVHEDMFKTRGVAKSDGTIRKYPEFPIKESSKFAKLILTKNPALFLNNMLLVTGEIPRKTNFEKGYQHHKVLKNGSWQPDPSILDDRALIVNLKKKGLVIFSGCAHSGIINTIKYAIKITGISKIYAVIGGFHLSGKNYEQKIKRTIQEIQNVNPEIIIPAHCTGWRAKYKIATQMPKKFVWNSVGNLYKL